MKVALLNNQKKFIKNILVFKPIKFAYFIIDQILLLLTVSLFIYAIAKGVAIEKGAKSWESIIILVLTFYLVIKFVIINWFGLNVYFKYIKVFEYSLKVDKNKIKVGREVDYQPLWFMTWTICSVIITAIICFYETQKIGTNTDTDTLIMSIINIVLNILLVPSFINTLSAITTSKKNIQNNYSKLVKDQYYSNESLFENIEWGDKQLNLTCKNVELSSKNGIFVTLNSDDLNLQESKDIGELNKKILNSYKDIWTSYYNLLQERLKNKFSKRASKQLYYIERVYDQIFLDFYAI
ncbi:hypothetical protein [Spiroplasma tabanidicola]|nr:hypothetical protein [Spiroplasma tabanidicola]